MAIPINIEDLLRKQRIEGHRIEFKSGWNPDSIYHSICAFANDFDNIGGGYILVGVEESGGIAKRPVKGISAECVDNILKDMVGFNNKINPYYMPRTSVEEIDGKLILVIWVPAGVNRPYDVRESVISKNNPKTQWYIRSGSSTIVAKGEVLEELREMANRTPFDDRGNPDIRIDDISPVLVFEYLKKIDSKLAKLFKDTPLEEILDKMDLYAGPRERRMIKNVAAMMFCENPCKFFPCTQVDIVIFPKGLENDPNNMIEVPKIEGPVPYMIRATLDYLKTNVIQERISKPKDRAESEKFCNYPYQAFEEAVVNALYHRDYAEREPVEIRIEPHEISILSYSGPDRSISMEAIQQAKALKARRYRNRRLGDFLKELNLSEGRATGIPTIQEELRKNGSAKARIETDDNRSYFLIEIPCRMDFYSGSPSVFGRSEPESEPESEPKNGGKDVKGEFLAKQKTANIILALIRNNPAITVAEVVEESGKSRTTVQNNIKLLKQKGVIRRIGANKGGQWEVLV